MSPTVGIFALAALMLAIGAIVVHRFRLPPLPAYLVLGLIVGPRLDVDALEPLPSIGLLLLLFSVGQEFGPERLRSFGRTAWRAGAWDLVPLGIGTGAGLALGWNLAGAVFLGAVFYVSSSAVIAKLLIDLRRTGYPEAETILGILVLEDLVIAAILTALATGAGIAGLAISLALSAGYLAVSQLVAPHLVRFLESLSDELVLLLMAAFTTGTAVLFEHLGASAAVGAFLCGVVAAGLGLVAQLERLFGPIRDLAVAFFFFTVGANALGGLGSVSALAVVLTVAALVTKLPFDYRAGRVAGLGRPSAASTALFLVPRGEFNLVVATLAAGAGFEPVAQVAVLTVLISIPLGTLLVRYQQVLVRHLPGRLRPTSESPPVARPEWRGAGDDRGG